MPAPNEHGTLYVEIRGSNIVTIKDTNGMMLWSAESNTYTIGWATQSESVLARIDYVELSAAICVALGFCLFVWIITKLVRMLMNK